MHEARAHEHTRRHLKTPQAVTMRRSQLSFLCSSLLRSSPRISSSSSTSSLITASSSSSPPLIMLSACSTTTAIASSSFSTMHDEYTQPLQEPQQLQPSEEQEPPGVAAPMLLLEGDEFFVSHDGVCRTYYELEGRGWEGNNNNYSFLGLEEEYNLKTAKKTFVLRTKEISTTKQQEQHQEDPSSLAARKPFSTSHTTPNEHGNDGTNAITAPPLVLSKHAKGVVRLGKSLNRIELQEIDQGVFGSAGTGATTWEASIAMALFHHSTGTTATSRTPALLKGNVLELGSGVGLAGILLMQQQQHQHPHDDRQARPSHQMASLTLTDGNDEVLRECRHNWHHHCLSHQHRTKPPLYIRHLDWHAPIKNDDELYDTILASDCAYKHKDIVALAVTMKGLLRPGGNIHIFGPHNRGALQQLLLELKRLDMNVQVNGLEMNRYRLQSKSNSNNNSKNDDESVFCSRNVVRFLHITATHKMRSESAESSRRRQEERLQDID